MDIFTRPIDKFLNIITMYRLLTYGLIILLAIGVLFSFTGALHISGAGILAVTMVSVFVSYVTNKGLSLAFNVTTNNESYLITALILVFILPPSTTVTGLCYVALANVIAITSKFIISYRHKHIFNPAAFGAVTVGLLGLLSITWWVGNPCMLPFVAVLGFLIVRKIHRSRLFIAFLFTAVSMMILVSIVSELSVVTILKTAVLSSPLIFFATIMLTEPATMPSTQYYQILFGILVGAAYASQLHLDFINTSTSPQLVLLGGNVFAYMFNHKATHKLRLKYKVIISPQVYDFVFTPDKRISYFPGQYMEWTLGKGMTDGRGNRRSFTLASSPTEADVHLGIKFYEPSSSFKVGLRAMQVGDLITVSQLSGSFTMPADHTVPLVFIAGGIGITPFRSMLKYLVDTNQPRSVVLFYIVRNQGEIAYKDVLSDAKRLGIKIILIVRGVTSNRKYPKEFSMEILAKYVPEYLENKFYISGPNALVEAYRYMLIDNYIPHDQIVTDYFSGY